MLPPQRGESIAYAKGEFMRNKDVSEIGRIRYLVSTGKAEWDGIRRGVEGMGAVNGRTWVWKFDVDSGVSDGIASCGSDGRRAGLDLFVQQGQRSKQSTQHAWAAVWQTVTTDHYKLEHMLEERSYLLEVEGNTCC
jgi:hypothetical protein